MNVDNRQDIYYVLLVYIQNRNLNCMGKRKKQKSDKSDQNEDVKLVVRIEVGLRDAFIEACQERDTTASREVRRFIRDFLARSGQET